MSQICNRYEIVKQTSNVSGTANTYIEDLSQALRLNMADFDGTVTVYFEASIKNNGSAGQTSYLQLFNHTDNVAVSGTELTTTQTGFGKYLRSSTITLSGDKIYTVQAKHSNTTTNNVYGSARVVIYQSGSFTKTQLQIEIGAATSTSSTLSSNALTSSGQFLYEAIKYDGTITIRHDALLKTTAGNTATCGLYDLTGSAVVTSSEVSKTNDTNYSLLSSSTITLTDGHIYAATAYVSAGAAVNFSNSKIVINISGFTKFLFYMVASASGSGISNAADIFPNYLDNVDFDSQYDTGDFTGCNVTTYFESISSINSSAQTVHTNLATYINATSASDIVGTDLTHTGDTNRVRNRSASFTMTTGPNELCCGVSSTLGSSSAFIYYGYLILEVTGVSSGIINFNRTPTIQRYR